MVGWRRPPGEQLAGRQSEPALNRCDADPVSPAAMTSDLVKREVEHALTSDRFQDRLFPVMIRPTKRVPGYFSLVPY